MNEDSMHTWITREGVELRVVDMEDRHLVNTIHFIERVWRRRTIDDAMDAFSYDGGDMAMVTSDGAGFDALEMADRMEPEDIADDFPVYPAMLDEAKKRRLLDHDYNAARFHG
jgi:hypothetical protein